MHISDRLPYGSHRLKLTCVLDTRRGSFPTRRSGTVLPSPSVSNGSDTLHYPTRDDTRRGSNAPRIGAEQPRRRPSATRHNKPQLYSSSSFIHHRLLSSHLSFPLDRPTVDHLAITATPFTPLSPTLFPLFGPWRMMINSRRDGATP